MKACGIPEKLIRLVKTVYDRFTCAVIYEGEITERFLVVTGVKQGCCMSGFLFLMVIDWMMKKALDEERTGIRWDFTMLLEDIDYTDDLLLLTSRADHMQENYLALHCREGEGQTRMEHIGKSEAGSKQPPAVEGRCLGFVCLLAQGELTTSNL